MRSSSFLWSWVFLRTELQSCNFQTIGCVTREKYCHMCPERRCIDSCMPEAHSILRYVFAVFFPERTNTDRVHGPDRPEPCTKYRVTNSASSQGRNKLFLIEAGTKCCHERRQDLDRIIANSTSTCLQYSQKACRSNEGCVCFVLSPPPLQCPLQIYFSYSSCVSASRI